ncbi:class III extradiol dioxygenase subunit B-like domain-containing protein [Streptomyces sp. NPDC049906]|uniref:class III extradiol dioxygenase subunit B-like domain-containing protein n=1 Tax=Streptomyces sp. NPDC049906 TaxID=3155656 RepID=UPI0034162263
MLVAAALCPCPPLLVPEVAAGAAAELDGLRTACDEALRGVLAARPELIVVVGPGPGTGATAHEQGAPGTFRALGVPVDVRLGRPAAEPPVEGPPLPLPLAIGAWLLDRAGWTGPVRGLSAGADRDWADNRADGARAAESGERVGLLVLGEGSARRDLKAPGYLDERAPAVDADLARALARADDEAFLPWLDADLARELMVSGRSPWQVLDGAAEGRDLTGRLLYDAAPYGVGYFVALWN